MDTNKKLEQAFRDEEDRLQQRVKELDSTAPDPTRPGGDKQLGDGFYNKESKPNDHVSQKVYYFPPSYNALRKELETWWKDFFEGINPLSGTSPAYCMVFDAPQFIGYMNGFTGLSLQLDGDNVEWTCKQYLNALRKMRNISEIQ